MGPPDVGQHVVPLLGAVQAERAVHARLLAALIADVKRERALVAVGLTTAGAAVVTPGAGAWNRNTTC